MRKNFALAAFLVIFTLVFAAPIFANAEGGGTAHKTDAQEGLVVVMDEWIAPGAKGNPFFWFYENYKGLMRIQEDDEAWAHLDYFYDPERSEYVISGNGGSSATARLVRSAGKPDKLTISGKILDHADRWVEFEYELVRKADVKKAGPSLPTGKCSIRKPELHWMHGEWKTRSGAPITLSAITRTEAPPFLYFQIKDGREPGYDLSVTVDLDWEASEKAFRMWDGEKSIQEGRTVFMYEQTRGYVWPSAGEDADSETLRMEYNSGGETFEAVLERVKT